MNIILFTKLGGHSAVLRFNQARCYLPFMMIFVLLCGALLQLGYQFGRTGTISGLPRTEFAANAPDSGLAQAQINTLAQRIGLMRAQVQRLDALGRRLSQVAGINPDEFRLDAAPAVGGPKARLVVEAPTLGVVQQALEQLAQFIDVRERHLNALDGFLWSHGFTEPHFSFGEPAVQAYVSSGFGMRSDPFTGLMDFHKGVDFAGRAGTPVLAAADGVVSWVGPREGYGLLVEIDHSNGLVTRYGHTLRTLVRNGEVVSKGQVVALMGSSGRSTGPHVHFEVLQAGVAVDPVPYLASLGRVQ